MENQEQRPEGLPENFKTVADLAKSYNELHAQFTKNQQTETPKVEPKGMIPEPPKVAPIESFQKEYAEHGALSDATYDKLQKEHGLSRQMVDTYIKGQEALAQSAATAAQSVVGGQEQYSKMVSWASQNLSEQEIRAFNSVISGGNPQVIEMAVRGLYAKYSQTAPPSTLTGTGKVTQGLVRPFADDAEMKHAMMDAKYNKDPEYTREVHSRVAAMLASRQS